MAVQPLFLPGESHGQRSLAGYSSWDQKESDTSEVTNTLSLQGKKISSQKGRNLIELLKKEGSYLAE